MARSNRFRFPIAALGAAALCACATTTPYQPLQRGEGYSEQRIEANRYRVAFAGSSATPRRTVETYLLYRAAELTLANGYDHFLLSGSTTGERAQRAGNAGVGFGGFSIGSSGGVGIGIGTSAGSRDAPLEQADVVMFKGPKPMDNPVAYDAHDIKASLEKDIRRPDPSSQGEPRS